MAKTFDAIYENGVFRPLEPLPLVDGLRVGLTISPPVGPLTEKDAQAMFRLGGQVYEGFTDEELADLEADILGDRLSGNGVQKEQKR